MTKISDQSGRTFIVTGANSGLGAVTATRLDAAGAHVVLACRDLAKAEQVAATLSDRATVAQLDLADLDSVTAFAKAQTGPIDVLVNNAGIMAPPLRRTKAGFESQFGTNHLGHFALTGLLLDRITDRVVTVSSGAQYYGKLNFDDPNYEHRRYVKAFSYGQSKLANFVFARELQRRLRKSGSPVLSVAAHPGVSPTGLTVHAGPAVTLLFKVVGSKPEQAAQAQLHAATAPGLHGGEYFGPALIPGRGVAPSWPAPWANNKAAGAKLWELSERLTGVNYLDH